MASGMAESDVGFTLEMELELLGLDELDFYSEEERRVLLWRLLQFTLLGFDYATSMVMADSPIDLGQARRLASGGCPPETASRILL